MAYGNEYGLAVVDIVQKICLLNLSTQEIYGSLDMYIKTPRSPKRLESVQSKEDQLRSPSIDQVSSFDLVENVHAVPTCRRINCRAVTQFYLQNSIVLQLCLMIFIIKQSFHVCVYQSPQLVSDSIVVGAVQGYKVVKFGGLDVSFQLALID